MATGLFGNKASSTGMWRGRKEAAAAEGCSSGGDTQAVGLEVYRKAHVKRRSPLWSHQEGQRVQAIGIC